MGLAVIPSVLFTHYVFGLIFSNAKTIVRSTIPILTSAISIVGLKWLPSIRFIRTGFDLNGYWDIVLLHFGIALLLWELLYQVSSRTKLNLV